MNKLNKPYKIGDQIHFCNEACKSEFGIILSINSKESSILVENRRRKIYISFEDVLNYNDEFL